MCTLRRGKKEEEGKEATDSGEEGRVVSIRARGKERYKEGNNGDTGKKCKGKRRK